MEVAASTLADRDTANLTVTEDVLRVTNLTLNNLNVTGDLEETDELVDCAVEVFGRATRLLAEPLDDDRSGEQETRKSLRETLALHVDNLCLDLTADIPPGDAVITSSSQDYHFSCQNAFPRSKRAKESEGVTDDASQMVFMSSQPDASSKGALPATPPMSIVVEDAEFAAMQVVHLQTPGTIADVLKTGPDAATRRRLTSSCKALPVSELRLFVPERLAGTTKMLIKQRVDLTAEARGCKRYQIRQATGQLHLPRGLVPIPLLHDIKFDGVGVIQKFYTAVVEFQDAMLLDIATTDTRASADIADDVQINSGVRKSHIATKRSKVVAVGIKLVEEPLFIDYALSYNSFLDFTENDNFYQLSLACWLAILIIVLLLLIFGVLMLHAVCRANRAGMRDERKKHLERMYLADGGIDIFAFPKSMGERLSCGMGHCGAHNCCSALTLRPLACSDPALRVCVCIVTMRVRVDFLIAAKMLWYVSISEHRFLGCILVRSPCPAITMCLSFFVSEAAFSNK